MELQFLSLPRVLEKTDMKRSTLYAYVKAGIFPAPVQLGPNQSRWVASEVEEWMHSRISARDCATPAASSASNRAAA